jgi:hypothetical protein
MRKDWVSYIGDYKFYIKLWLAFYLYSLTVGLLVQLVILPMIFPSAHWKYGLMVGGDWVQFHTEGVEIAKRVQQEGWSVWTLRHPISGQVMSGIAGLFYALTGIHKPWVLLPFNAFLHASAGLILYILLRLLDISKKTALIFTIPFIIFPTSLTWVSQIHKDGLYILGMYLTFLSLALAFPNEIKKNVIAVWRNEIWAQYLSGRPGAIDEDIKFRSVGDFIEYTPRALTVGFFSPFPRFWFSQGSTTGGTIARYITPFEAIYLWFAWLLLPIALWSHRKKLWFWLVFLMCLGFVWFHVVAEPNVGPIVRKRYGYVMLLSAVSYSTATELWRRRKGKE